MASLAGIRLWIKLAPPLSVNRPQVNFYHRRNSFGDEMQPNSVERYLAEFPPTLWKLALERGIEIERYLRNGPRNLIEHDTIAATLNLKRRKLYILIDDFKKAQSRHDLRFRHGWRSPINQRAFELIDKAIQAHGESERESVILAAVEEACAALCITPPSLTTIRTRMSRTPAKPCIAHRVGSAADLVIDSCQLDAFAIDPQNKLAPVYLTALIDGATGAILGHELTPSPPTGSTGLNILLASQTNIRAPLNRLKLVLSADLSDTDDTIARAAQGLRMGIVPLGRRRIRTGSTLVATFGRRIGRIPTCQHRKPTPCGQEIPFTRVKGVVDLLIERRNALLQEHAVECT